MNIAIDKTMKTVNEMIADYELDRSFVTLVGGGGSGAVLRITSYNVCYTKLLRSWLEAP